MPLHASIPNLMSDLAWLQSLCARCTRSPTSGNDDQGQRCSYHAGLPARLARHPLYFARGNREMLGANRNPCKRKRLVGVLNDDTIPMWRIPTLFSIT